MLDDFGKKKALEALEEAVSPLAGENGGPLLKDRIRAAVNRDTRFSGQMLTVSGESAAPNAPLFAKLCSHIRLVSTALLTQCIGADRQDIAALPDSLPPGTVAQ
jgi:hypothetical protein